MMFFISRFQSTLYRSLAFLSLVHLWGHWGTGRWKSSQPQLTSESRDRNIFYSIQVQYCIKRGSWVWLVGFKLLHTPYFYVTPVSHTFSLLSCRSPCCAPYPSLHGKTDGSQLTAIHCFFLEHMWEKASSLAGRKRLKNIIAINVEKLEATTPSAILQNKA